MKKSRKVVLLALFICSLFGLTSCAVFVTRDAGRQSSYKKDNGLHKGWFKNTNNPKHINSTNPGQSDEKKKVKKHKP